MAAEQYDLVIRGGSVVDGSGGEPFVGDVAVKAGVIAAVGSVKGASAEEIDAAGLLVTPGFVDVHTHYDGQVTWETTLSPSSDHGVTTVVMGNCGVGFAPVRVCDRQLVIELMEGVEDIPGVVMAEGVPWNWESFPDYLDALEERVCDIDFAAQLPHSALRVYVMGQRGADMQPPTQADLAAMRRLTAEAVKAGALGVTTSRALSHRFPDGRLAPSVSTEEEELMALAEGLRDAGRGVFQMIPDTGKGASHEFALIRRIAERSGRPVSFTFSQTNAGDDGWRAYLRGLDAARADGLAIKGQFLPRPTGVLFGLDLSLNPFVLHPSYQPLKDLPLADKVRALRDADLRARLLSETPEGPNPFLVSMVSRTATLFSLGDPPNYTPPLSETLAARAAAAGADYPEYLLDRLLEDEGRAVLYCPIGNMEDDRLDSAAKLAGDPGLIFGLGDGGAHYGSICDASWPTYFLLTSVRDALDDRRLALPRAVQMLARDPAEALGLRDRGLLRAGYKADINVIDLDALHLYAPRATYDLPTGGRRLSQKADGYVATVVSGQVTYRGGQATGAAPGRLIRGARDEPPIPQ